MESVMPPITSRRRGRARWYLTRQAAGAHGVVRTGGTVQVITGTDADALASGIDDMR
jgi:hypothetical protein